MIRNIAKEIIKDGGSIIPLVVPFELGTNGTGLCNPSILVDGNDIWVNVRHVQYSLHSTMGKYQSRFGPLAYLNPDNDFTLTTKNYLGRIVDNNFLDVKQIDMQFDVPPIWEFVGLEDVIKKRTQGTSIGFAKHVDATEETKEVTPEDLVRYGMIPEFVGRFTSIVCLHGLTKEQLISILTEIKNNFVGQYQWLFDQDSVELNFDTESLDLIAERTLATKTGARGLHSELERVLMPHMYDLPRYRKNNIVKVTINKTQVNTPMTLIQENS